MLSWVMNMGFAASGSAAPVNDIPLYDEGFNFSFAVRF